MLNQIIQKQKEINQSGSIKTIEEKIAEQKQSPTPKPSENEFQRRMRLVREKAEKADKKTDKK
jgi:hypothetical protein